MVSLQSVSLALRSIEDLFFTWLWRSSLAATLVGCAWIDDAPPLDIAALLIAFYVLLRLFLLFPVLADAAPLARRWQRNGLAVLLIVIIGFCFLSMVTFVEALAMAAVG
jgi:hypothetical protein